VGHSLTADKLRDGADAACKNAEAWIRDAELLRVHGGTHALAATVLAVEETAKAVWWFVGGFLEDNLARQWEKRWRSIRNQHTFRLFLVFGLLQLLSQADTLSAALNVGARDAQQAARPDPGQIQAVVESLMSRALPSAVAALGDWSWLPHLGQIRPEALYADWDDKNNRFRSPLDADPDRADELLTHARELLGRLHSLQERYDTVDATTLRRYRQWFSPMFRYLLAQEPDLVQMIEARLNP